MPPKSCSRCGNTDLETDTSLGQVTCTQCGYVVERGLLVAEVGFSEGAGGRIHQTGQFVSNYSTGIAGLRSRNQGESSENVKRNGQEKIQEVARDMGLGAGIASGATRSFSLLVDQRFNKGRRTEYLVASCLYLQCRLMKEPYMLIDFSERLQVNVFELAGTYLKLRASLLLDKTMPEHDPAIYNIHFARRLSLGPMAQVVAADASRLVRRFKADWMTQGRRPAGICGACLIIASRMSNFLRTPEEVGQVVKCSPTTIRQRLREFAMTQMAQKTVKEWRGLTEDELTQDMNEEPPIVKLQRLQAEKLEARRLQELQDAEDAEAEADDNEDDDGSGNDEDDTGGKKKRKGKGKAKEKAKGKGKGKRKRGRDSEINEASGQEERIDADEALMDLAADIGSANGDGLFLESDAEGDDLEDLPAVAVADDLDAAADRPEEAQAARKKDRRAYQRENQQANKAFTTATAEFDTEFDFGELDGADVIAQEIADEEEQVGDEEGEGGGLQGGEDDLEVARGDEKDDEYDPTTQLREMGTTQPPNFSHTKPDEFSAWDDQDQTLSHFCDLYFSADPGLTYLRPDHIKDRVAKWLPAARDPRDVAWECKVVDAAMKRREWEAKESREEVIEGLDEDELDEYWVLDDRDKQLRASVWLSQNGKWLEQNRLKEEQKAAYNRANGIDPNAPPKPKRKRGAPTGPRQPYKSARDAIEGFATTKKFSNRINYGALRGLKMGFDNDDADLERMDEKDDDDERFMHDDAAEAADDKDDNDMKSDEDEDPSSYW